MSALCDALVYAEGRICDRPAVGVYIDMGGGKNPRCQECSDALYRRWGIRLRPLPHAAASHRAQP